MSRDQPATGTNEAAPAPSSNKTPAGAVPEAVTAAGSWRAHEFDAAPTEEQLSKIRAEEQRRKELKAQAGQQQATVTDAIKSIKPEDFMNVHNAPCTRQGMLTGIGGGAAIGGLRFVIGGAVPKAANWAAGGFIAASVASYELCQYQRRKERENMKRVVEVYDRRATELRQKQADEKRRKETEDEAARLADQKRWYKFW